MIMYLKGKEEYRRGSVWLKGFENKGEEGQNVHQKYWAGASCRYAPSTCIQREMQYHKAKLNLRGKLHTIELTCNNWNLSTFECVCMHVSNTTTFKPLNIEETFQN